MIQVEDIADAIVSELKAKNHPAVMVFNPKTELKDLKYKIFVFPASEDAKPNTRSGSHANVVTCDVVIGVNRKMGAIESETRDLIRLTRNIGRSYLRRVVCGCTCTSANYMPLYDAEQIMDMGEFSGVIKLSFIGYEEAYNGTSATS